MMAELSYQQLVEKNKQLENRAKRLSEDKANLFLIHHLLEMLTPEGDIGSQLMNVLIGLGQCLGGTNIEIYYYAGQQLNYLDLLGSVKSLDKISDDFVVEIFESKEFIEKPSTESSSFLVGAKQSNAWDWGFPLEVNNKMIGAIKVNNAMGSVLLRDYLTPFFRHLALILNNQIITQSEEAANKAKSDFLAVMSHEIRTPMNAILGMAERLLKPGLTESERLQYAEVVCRSGNGLLLLLNDILDLSKIEAGKIRLHQVSFSPIKLLAELRLLFSDQIDRKGLALEIETELDYQQMYLADTDRLTQMLSNLINNAIKFTSRGGIQIKVTEVKRMKRNALLEFSVTDSGIGISENKQALLFKAFSQVDSSISRQYGGTGLGLSIVHQLAYLMKGTVGCQSTPGKGSKFWFRVRVGLDNSQAGDNLPERSADIQTDFNKDFIGNIVLSGTQAAEVKQLVDQLENLLAEQMFAAIRCFKELKEQLKDTKLEKQLLELEMLISNMEFEAAAEFLTRLLKHIELDL